MFPGIDSALAGAEVDVVSVRVPRRAPAADRGRAAAGKHVLCEKPMALALADCDAMIEATKRAGVAFTIGQCVRFPRVRARQAAHRRRGGGTPAAVRIRRGGDFPHTDTDWYADPGQSGGVLFDLMVHDLDWLRWCFGPVTRVYAKGLVERLAGGGLEHLDYALVTCATRAA